MRKIWEALTFDYSFTDSRSGVEIKNGALFKLIGIALVIYLIGSTVWGMFD